MNEFVIKVKDLLPEVKKSLILFLGEDKTYDDVPIAIIGEPEKDELRECAENKPTEDTGKGEN